MCTHSYSLSHSYSHSLTHFLFLSLSLSLSLLQYIISQLNELDCSRWNITLDAFRSNTPFGEKTFTNIIATLDPEKSKRLVLAAHYDSKKTPHGFLGATDSAVPVALILDVVLTLSKKLEEREVRTINHRYNHYHACIEMVTCLHSQQEYFGKIIILRYAGEAFLCNSTEGPTVVILQQS